MQQRVIILQMTFSDNLTQLKKHYESKSRTELTKNKNEILGDLKSELAARYYGAEGRIKKSLEYDRQLQVSLKLVKDEGSFKKLLHR